MRYGWILVLVAWVSIPAESREPSKARWETHSGQLVRALIRQARAERVRGRATSREIARNFELSLTPVWALPGHDQLYSADEFSNFRNAREFCRIDLGTRQSLSRTITGRAEPAALTGRSTSRLGKRRTLDAWVFERDQRIVLAFDPNSQSREDLVVSRVECSGIRMSDVPAVLERVSDQASRLFFMPHSAKLVAALQK